MPLVERPELVFDFATNQWELSEDWHGEVDGVAFSIPKGYTFDLASIPRVLWWLVAPIELGGAAPPLIHDYLYGVHGLPESGVEPLREYTRLETDRMFLTAMTEMNVSKFKRVAAFLAVRMFGWLPWPPAANEVRDMFLRAWNTAWQVGLALLFTREPWMVLWLTTAFATVKGLVKPTFFSLMRYLLFKPAPIPQDEEA